MTKSDQYFRRAERLKSTPLVGTPYGSEVIQMVAFSLNSFKT